MPRSHRDKSLGDLKRLVQHYERDLTRRQAISQEELDELRQEYHPKGYRPSKGDWWHWWADLRAYAKRKAWTERKRGNIHDADALEEAIAALEERAEVVDLPSAGETVRVTPASRARIEILEDHANLELRLLAARTYLHGLIAEGKGVKSGRGIESELCSECDRPLEAANTTELLERVTKEVAFQRACIYGQATAPGPEPLPVGTVVEWADRITPEEEVLLLTAYHRVNVERLQKLPKPVAQDGTMLPPHWGWLFARLASKERKPAHVIMRDRSLVSIVAVATLEGHRDAIQREEAKTKAVAGQKSHKTARRAPRRARSSRRRG